MRGSILFLSDGTLPKFGAGHSSLDFDAQVGWGALADLDGARGKETGEGVPAAAGRGGGCGYLLLAIRAGTSTLQVVPLIPCSPLPAPSPHFSLSLKLVSTPLQASKA